MDPQDAFDRALHATATIVKAIEPAQLGEPTPCTEWNVRELLNHVVGGLWLHEALLTDGESRFPMDPGQLPASDLVGADPAAAYRDAATAATAAVNVEGTLSSSHVTPLGEMPGAALLGFTTLDLVVHGWDLARATRQDAVPAELDPELVGHVLDLAQQMITDDLRGPFIRPAVPVDPGAPTVDRLAAFMGRTP